MTKEERSEINRRNGSKGGQATVQKYGVEHMRQLGKLGFIAALEHSGYSDAGHMINHWLKIGRLQRR